MALEAYTHLRSFESDFDGAQGTIRGTASLWVLAAFAGFSYALSVSPLPHDLTRAFLGVVLAWAAAFGLLILWTSDQLVYQKLLHSTFVHGLFMEWRDPSLPQIRTKAYSDNLNVSSKLSMFYIAPMIAFWVVEFYFAFGTGPAFKLPLPQTISSEDWLSVLVLMLFLKSHAAFAVYIISASRRDRNLLQEHGALYPAAFKKYIADQEFRVRLQQLFEKADIPSNR
jgi:hypothetical protein